MAATCSFLGDQRLDGELLGELVESTFESSADDVTAVVVSGKKTSMLEYAPHVQEIATHPVLEAWMSSCAG